MNTKCGSYKDDRTSDRVDVFSVERGRKKTYKGFEYFSQGHDQESCGKHLFLLRLIFCNVLHIGQLTIKHFNILEPEVNRSGIFAESLWPFSTRLYIPVRIDFDIEVREGATILAAIFINLLGFLFINFRQKVKNNIHTRNLQRKRMISGL